MELKGKKQNKTMEGGFFKTKFSRGAFHNKTEGIFQLSREACHRVTCLSQSSGGVCLRGWSGGVCVTIRCLSQL